MKTKFPNIKVKLTGTDGNAFALIGKVAGALRKAKVPAADVTEFTRDAMSGNYDHVLATCRAWVEVR